MPCVDSTFQEGGTLEKRVRHLAAFRREPLSKMWLTSMAAGVRDGKGKC